MTAQVQKFHPQLRSVARLVPRFTFTPRLLRVLRWIQNCRGTAKLPEKDGLAISDRFVQTTNCPEPVRVRVYRPTDVSGARPALLWLHGGGFIMGTPEQDEQGCIDLCRELGLVVAAVDYRLSPEHPFPAPMDDAYAALEWLYDNSELLGVDPAKIAVGGNSAGAGMAAGLTLLAHDKARIQIAFQLLIYPMLDDRTAIRTDVDERNLRMWNNRSNHFGWHSYLGMAPGSDSASEYAAPGRRADLRGLPPVWLGIGTCDLFYIECLDYAHRLQQADVPCTLKIVDGAFHGFEIAGANKPLVRDFRQDYTAALAAALDVKLSPLQ